jgi:hypothetical protein
MKMWKLIGLCAAAAIAAGSASVHALKLMEDGMAPTLMDLEANGVDSIRYAKETLTDTSATTVEDSDDVKYYRIDRVHAVAAPTSIGTVGSGDDYLVSIQLDGMVFSVGGDDGGAAPALTIGTTVDAGRLILNGTDGSASAVFQVPGVVATGEIITLLAQFAIGADGVGTIMRTDRNRTLEGVVDMYSQVHGLSGAIKALPALVEKVSPAKTNPTAKAALGFKMFAGESTIESLGTVQIGVRGGIDGEATGVVGMQYRNARTSVNVTMLSEISAGLGDIDENSATFAGNVGAFVKSMGLGTGTASVADEDAVCSAIAKDMRTMKDGDPTGELDVQQVDTFFDVQTLCVEVDGETAIPETEPYTVTTEYAGIDDAAFPPEGKTHDLSPIDRDGTYFHIPYLTTHDSYNQRVVIVNRGAATTYEFVDMQAESGATVSAGAMASGDLPTGQMVVRSTGIISGATRGSTTLTVVAPPSEISAAVQQVNTSTGGVDSVYLKHGGLSSGHLD